MKEERWVSIDGFIEVSDLGNVYSHHKDKLLKGTRNANGMKFNTSIGCFYGHRLVWEAFKGKIPEGYYVYCKNGDVYDFSLENLNIAPICGWAYHSGSVVYKDGVEYTIGESISKFAREHGVNASGLCRLLRKELKHFRGFTL